MPAQSHAFESTKETTTYARGNDAQQAVSAEILDCFLAQLPALAWIKDRTGRYIRANPSFLRFVGKAEAACIGNTDDALWPAEIARHFSEADALTIQSPATRESIEILPSVSGKRYFQVRRFPVRLTSGEIHAGGIACDVTRSEVIFASEFIGVLECSGDRVVDANDTLLGWLGFSRDDLPELNWRTMTPARYRTQDDNAMNELRSNGASRPYEKELLDHAGQPVSVLVNAAALDMTSGSFLWFILNLGDRGRIESRPLRAQKLESLGLIAGGVAHDFNNLLATIMGNASLSLDAISREHPAFRPLSEVVVASRRASDLTQQVLAYSGRASVQIQPIDVSAAVREIGSLLETTISKKITLNFDLAQDLPTVDADQGQLQQIIMNLVINASEAIGERPGEIDITTRQMDSCDRGKCVCLEVRDTGCGMSEATRARIFDPFYTTKPDGRGLGLATVLSIVRSHRGALLVESELGQGTTFRVVLPAGDSQPVRAEKARPPQDLWGNEMILVADDDEGIRRMTKIALERLGYRVVLASDGAEAVEAFRAHRDEIAVVLLDWAMPVMNGDEALQRMLVIDPSAKILMSSGYAETETLQRTGTSLLAGFVQKPYTSAQLAERLREVIAGHSGAGAR